VLSLAAVFALGGQWAFGQSEPEHPAYLNTKLSVDDRVDDLVRRMTLEEKVSQVVHLSAPVPRLHIAAYNWWTEALHGVASGKATVFPEPIGLGATFDPALIHRMGVVIATEARAKHEQDLRDGNFSGVGLDFWAPNLNIFRDPRWGRGQETYGEDPFLTGRMGVAYVTGMQGDNARFLRVIATPKHYAVHSGPEPERHRIDVPVSKHDEEDTYLPAFRDAVVEGKAGSVMCVYNSINGQPGCANEFLLGDTLRNKWGFQGYVVSDCDAVWDIERGHHYVKTHEEAAALSMRRGTDLDCNDPGNDYHLYLQAVKQGLLKESELDVAVKRLMRARMLLGMFDPPETVPFANVPMTEVDSADHRALALQASEESLVLLKNSGVLPFQPTVKNIVVVGPLADQTKVLFGNYHGDNPRMVSVLEGLRQELPNAQISFEPGTDFLRQALPPAPSSLLRSASGQQGLDAEYFRGIDLAGEAIVHRVDAVVDFDFLATPPSSALGSTNFSARWTGFLVPDKTGDYTVGFSGDDGYRLWVDGKLVSEDWDTHGVTSKSAQMHLQAGHRYALRAEYFQGGGGAEAHLLLQPVVKRDWQSEALAVAKKADVVVAVVGITSELEGEEMTVTVPGFHGGDRTSLDLPAEEQSLLEAMKSTGKPLVVVLMNGSALSINWAAKNADAILDAWYGGEEGGRAVAQTLTGKNNPSGRLPVTFYKGVDQLPSFTDYSMQGRTYRYFTGEPLYRFGYGLSYTQFAYSNLRLSAAELKAGDPLTATVAVKNAGAVAGDEVVELYLAFPKVDGAPLRALRGFQRVSLQPGETRNVTLTLDARDLSMVDAAGDRLVKDGAYTLSVGSGQPGSGAALVEGNFNIHGDAHLPE
jgi:beta-glucosidase